MLPHEELRARVAAELALRESKTSTLGNWAGSTPIVLDGRPFTFKKHEFLRVPYADFHPNQVELKAAQMTGSLKQWRVGRHKVMMVLDGDLNWGYAYAEAKINEMLQRLDKFPDDHTLGSGKKKKAKPKRASKAELAGGG